MANTSNLPLRKERKRVKMRSRILILIITVVMLQLFTYTAVLIYGGEFRDLREYSYNSLVEKTESGGAYVRNELWERSAAVQEYAKRLDSVVSDILTQRGASAADLRRDRALSESVMEASADVVASLLRGAAVNDAYFILDTGELYAGDGAAMACVYLRDSDANTNTENGDLMLVLGPESLSRIDGVSLHSAWTELFTPDPSDGSNYDFYTTAVRTAQEKRGQSGAELGYWSGLSRVAPSVTPSVKYSLPLMAGDGTVYGVLGVGLTRNNLIPAYDFLGENTCFVLGRAVSDGSYDILAYSGSAYSSLVGGGNTLRLGGQEQPGVYSVETAAGGDLTGSVQYVELYGADSPYAAERWALISVADRSGVLRPLLFLRRMLVVSTLLSLIVAAVVAVPGCAVLVKPLSNMSRLMRRKRNYNEVIRFQPSNIYEIDEITDAVTQLQINVQGFSSQVSKMISVADVGLGTFTCDRTEGTVFVGQSLIKVLGLKLPQGEDIVISLQEFLSSIENPEIRSLIAAGLGMTGGNVREGASQIHQINRLDGSTFWMRLGFTYSPNMAIGIVQDITEAMIEKNMIEHERDYDNLTNLLSRPAYYRRIEELFHDKSKLHITAFVMVDLDNLKYVNDTYGHDFGDDYIRAAASALKRFEQYGGIVARLSGDEFNICLPGFSSKDEIREIIAKVRAELLQGTCLLSDGTHYRVSASMGVSWYPDDAESRELLMKYADFAMYTIKHSTKSGLAEFDINSYATDSDKLADLEELSRIIEESRVQYAFQSIVSVETGEVYGYEALMRVQSEIFRSPLELLNIAKSSARLHDIERLTWTKALADFQVLLDAGRLEKNARLFVNSIANHTLDEDVISYIGRTYPHLLEKVVMEIVESESADEDSIAHKERVLHQWGGQLALDDYGTGYNSEYALLSLHPDFIKIDRSIISNCDQDADRRMIIENLVKLSRAKGIHVLAEGVETQEEMAAVIACGVEFLQGYYLARPAFEPKPISPELMDTIRRLRSEKVLTEKENREESL